MAFSVLSVTGTIALAFSIYKCLSFVRFYTIARRTGFPIIISPIFSRSIPWMILGPLLQPTFEKYLPTWIHERMEIATHGWEFRNKRKFHDRLGDVFCFVTPDECSLWVADPALGNTILQQRNEFPQAPIVAKVLGFFGSNVFAANGDEWKRHRRMFATNLDERISKTAWIESCQQAQDMRKYIIQHPGNETLDSLKSVAINVIGQAGYSQKEPWAPNLRDRDRDAKGAKASYFETMVLATLMHLEAALIPAWFMRLPFMPEDRRRMGYHMPRVPGYVKALIDDERKVAEKASGGKYFLKLLVQLTDEDRRAGQSELTLSEGEISGNLFVFTVAGFETTANTMGYAVMLLAAYPEWQDWIREELKTLHPDPSTWDYEEVYPKLRRTLAIMLETLRLFPPVLHTTRAVQSPQQLTSPAGTHYLSPPMDVFVCQLSMHLDTRIWGPDAATFRPSRWLDDTGQLITPERGTYIPWSGGPRVCPGLKMSQVEFVGTMATLFRAARCEPLPSTTDGVVDQGVLRERLLGLVRDSVNKLALQIRDPTEVRLRWVVDSD